MEIRTLANNCFRLRGKNVTLLLGTSRKKTEADIVITSGQSERDKVTSRKRREPFWLPGPGEYEISGVEIWDGESGCWLIKMDGLKIGYLADGWRMPSDKKIESLGQIDLLILTLERGKERAQKAAEAIRKISPLIVVVSETEVQDLLDVLDQEGLQPEDKLLVKPTDLPEETKVVVLKVRQ